MKPRTGTAAGSGSSTGRGRHGGGQQGRRAESPAAAVDSQSPLRSPLPVQAGMRAASQVQPARASESPADHRHGVGHDGGDMERTPTRVRAHNMYRHDAREDTDAHNDVDCDSQALDIRPGDRRASSRMDSADFNYYSGRGTDSYYRD